MRPEQALPRLKPRVSRLTVRMASAMAAVTVAVLAANAVYLILSTRRDMRRSLEATAEAYARLATPSVCLSYGSDHAAGSAKFVEQTRSLLREAPEIRGLTLMAVSGETLFDSDELAPSVVPPTRRVPTTQGAVLDAVRRLAPTSLRHRNAGGAEELWIVVPFVEDSGDHRYSVTYRITDEFLRPRILRQVTGTIALTLLGIAASVVLGVALAHRIVRPITELTAGVQAIAAGEFDRRLKVHSSDELQVLADAFNSMAEDLRQYVDLVAASHRALEVTNAELATKNAELERFTYTVSHDLKSPLITIRAFVESLERDARQGNLERFSADVARIVGATDRMRRLLDDLLELSRVGRIVSPPTTVSLAALAREAAEATKGRLAARGVRLEIDPNLPEVRGDRQRLFEVFLNLIDNAAKFTGDQPAPLIEIGTRRSDDQQVVFVRDNGAGIDRRFQEKVFGLFEQLDVSREGTGVGLALVKRIVEAHGGRIWVESEGAGRGTTFCILLPAANAASPERTST